MKGRKQVLIGILIFLLLGAMLIGLQEVKAYHSQEHTGTSGNGTQHTEKIYDYVASTWSIDIDSTTYPKSLNLYCDWMTNTFGAKGSGVVDRVYDIIIDLQIQVPSGTYYTQTLDLTGTSLYNTGVWYYLGYVTFNLYQADFGSISEGDTDYIKVYYKYEYTEGITGGEPDDTWLITGFVYMYSIPVYHPKSPEVECSGFPTSITKERGDSFTVSGYIDNVGDQTANDVSVTLTLPTGVSTTSQLTQSFTSIDGGDWVSVSWNCLVSSTCSLGTLSLVITVDSDNAGSDVVTINLTVEETPTEPPPEPPVSEFENIILLMVIGVSVLGVAIVLLKKKKGEKKHE